MPLTDNKITTFLKKVVDLTDTPSENMSPADIKAWFDSSPEQLRFKHNDLVDDLVANTGAVEIGAKDEAGVTTTVQAQLDKLGSEKSPIENVESIELRMNDVEQGFASLEGMTNTRMTAAETIANGANVKSDLATAQANNIIANAGDSNTEIVDSRLRNDGTIAVNVGTHIREVAVQLAENVKYQKNEITPRVTNAIKPFATFITDDGDLSDYDIRYKSIFGNADVPFTLAIVTNRVGTAGNMNWQQIKDLHDNYKAEVTSHTHLHQELDKLTNEEVEFELSESKRILESQGYKTNYLMIPYGLYNNNIKRIAQKYYRGVRTSDSGEFQRGYNVVPIKNLQVASTATEFDDLAALKTRVDNAIADNAWVVFLSHSWETIKTPERLQNLTELIAYIKSLNVEIGTFDEGMNRFGSLVDVGQNSEFRVGVDGEIKSRQINTIYLDVNAVTGTTPITGFKRNTLSICSVNNIPNNGFPDPSTQAGMLLTYNFSNKEPNLIENGYQYQEFSPYGKPKKYERKCNTDGTWDVWYLVSEKNNKIIKVDNLPSNHTVADLTPESLTISTISGAGVTGYPENFSGTLIAYAFGAYTNDKTFYFEEYHIYNSTKKYIRSSNGSGVWGAWYNPNDITNNVIITQPRGTYTGDTLPNALPIGKLIHTSVSANTLNMPSTAAGMLTINTTGLITGGSTDYGYVSEEYLKYGTNEKWIRTATSATAWTAWAKITVV